MRLIEQIMSPQFFRCEICNECFVKKYNFERHEKSQRHNSRAKACAADGIRDKVKETIAQYNLQNGEHDNQLRFSKTYSLNYWSKRDTETGKKLHRCLHCGKEFTRLSNLKTHHAVHEENRPFKCCQCVCTFKYNHVLQRHVKLKHKPPILLIKFV